jgi:hypothetical protein
MCFGGIDLLPAPMARFPGIERTREMLTGTVHAHFLVEVELKPLLHHGMNTGT